MRAGYFGAIPGPSVPANSAAVGCSDTLNACVGGATRTNRGALDFGQTPVQAL